MGFEAPKLPDGFIFNVDIVNYSDGENVRVRLEETDGLKILGIVVRYNTIHSTSLFVCNNFLDTDHLHKKILERMTEMVEVAEMAVARKASYPSTKGIAGIYPPKKIVGGNA